jgi:hypothetical protein
MSGTFGALVWDDPTGGVLINVTGMAPGERVARVRKNGQAILLHTTDLPATATAIVDWQPPLGETAEYVILATPESAPGTATARTLQPIPGGNAYLRRLNDPLLVTKVRVLDTGTEGEEARQTIFDISGRRAPLVVFNSRAARRGTITLLTDTRDERNAIEFIVSDGSPLLFNMCVSKAFQPLQAAIGDVRWTRVEKRPTRFECELDYVEVQDGDWIGLDEDYLPPVFQALRYSDIATMTYQQIYDTYRTYLNLATGTPA